MLFEKIYTVVLALIRLLPESHYKKNLLESAKTFEALTKAHMTESGLVNFLNTYTFFATLATHLTDETTARMDAKSRFLIHTMLNLPSVRDEMLSTQKIDFFTLTDFNEFNEIFQKLMTPSFLTSEMAEIESTFGQVAELAEQYALDQEVLFQIAQLLIEVEKTKEAKEVKEAEAPRVKATPELPLKKEISIPFHKTSVEVLQGEIVYGEKEKVLYTRGLATCVGIALVAEKTHAIAHDACNLQKFYQEMRQKLEAKGEKNIKTFLVGGCCEIATLTEIESLLIAIMTQTNAEDGTVTLLPEALPNCKLMLFDGITSAAMQITQEQVVYTLEVQPAFSIAEVVTTFFSAAASDSADFSKKSDRKNSNPSHKSTKRKREETGVSHNDDAAEEDAVETQRINKRFCQTGKNDAVSAAENAAANSPSVLNFGGQ